MVEPLISARNIKKHFDVGEGMLKAVDGISFDIYPGETFGLVGESGCGKSTAGRTIIRLYEPTEGELIFNGKNVYSLSHREMQEVRKNFQMIFQDPYASLNPRMTVEEIVAEPLDIHHAYKNKEERRKRVVELLKLVGLNEEHSMRFPHEFSGGQRQRIGIARALALNPKFIVCDEPISALDVSIQAQVVNLLKELQEKLGLTYMFIAHDLSMVRYISDRVGVMYLGHMMELAPSEELYENPIHPYTKALLSAIPIPNPEIQRSRHRIMLEGDVPSPINPKEGCRFVDRCSYAMDKCRKATPVFEEIKPNHFVACHRGKEI
ncbi:ABC transporter ATP-binding protein [Tissierella praeacuta]|uniref:Oligopeptide transport system ATP-binding protein n=1 Tax=Tissierella praeacuta DSM 18095 TaxID=1123404 RepID=A0A1M4WL85_9FIRM|nr:oligopeptide/dipeptide ABC transporter ATP-binding protein [Tissierella praeacuta]MBU5255610.1 ATP-binding cassette domain-containing protein [Tissierella praeacuta]SHE81732.1 oligopeptide transport system ATP-binding protein [Tissierella praeacuta DSM 18095]SUO99345.1 Glutathione import ATP-binding protein GsiA [Tissierella praeacuta]HAE91703.1 oligopeptide ABC transporter ATP-binding protein OppF [Tissierella sp.]